MISDYAEQRQPIDFRSLNPDIFWARKKLPSSAPSRWHGSSRQGHDMRKGHTLFCILKYTQKQDNSGSGGLRELIQSYRMCYYKSHQETASKFLRFEQIHHPSWQPKAAEAAEHETGHDKMEAEAHHEEEWLVHLCWCGSQLSQLAWYIYIYICLYSFIIEL